MLIVKAMTLLNSVIAARLLSPQDFGSLSVIVNLQNMAVIIASFGVPLAITRNVAHWREDNPHHARAIWTTLMTVLAISSSIVSLVYFIFAEQIATQLYHDERLVAVIRLSAAFVLVSALNTGMSSLVQGCKMISTIAWVNALAAIAGQPLAYIMISWVGLEGAIVAMTAGTALSGLMFLHSVRGFVAASIHKTRAALTRKEVLALMNFAIPAFIGSLLVVPAYWIGRTVLALDWGFSSVGQFQIAESLSQVILILPAAISVPLLPLMSAQIAKDPKGFTRSSSSLIRITVFFALPLSIAVMPFIQSIVTILYGAEYESATNPAEIMLIASAYIAVGSVVSNAIISMGHMWDALKLNTGWLMCFLVILFLAVPSNGANGLSYTYAISYGLYAFLQLGYFSLRMRINMTVVGGFAAGYALVALLALGMMNTEFECALLFATGLSVALLTSGYKFLLKSEDRQILTSVFRRGHLS
jgi:O-antigen/teichoic acid export membrane protein